MSLTVIVFKSNVYDVKFHSCSTSLGRSYLEWKMIRTDLTLVNGIDQWFTHDVVLQAAHVVPVDIRPPWEKANTSVDREP
jgi:hypothetical protein